MLFVIRITQNVSFNRVVVVYMLRIPYTVRQFTLFLVYPISVVVELPQTLEDDPHKRKSCVWKSYELVTVGAWA